MGAGGKLLDNLLKKTGLAREDVYITNIVKCRPPKNRKPERDEIEACTAKYLERQIQLIRPRIICTLGATALQYFTGEKSMADSHGKLQVGKRFACLSVLSSCRNLQKSIVERRVRRRLEKNPVNPETDRQGNRAPRRMSLIAVVNPCFSWIGFFLLLRDLFACSSY